MALDRYALAGRIRELLDPELAAAGFELLEVRVFRGGGRTQVRVYVDAPGGIDLEGCTRASRTIDPLLEESGLIEERYVIEVSSPGVRRPLRKPEEFRRHLGETVEIRGGRPERPWRLRGRLLAADGQGVTISPLAEAPAAPVVDDEEAEDEEAAVTATEAAPAEQPPAAPAPTAPAEVPTAPAEGPPPVGEAATRRVAHGEILEANLEPEFDPQALIQADRRRRKLERREERQQERKVRRERPRRRPRRQGPAGDA